MDVFKIINEHTANTVVITPNRRLSALLHKHYQDYQIEHHNTSWLTPHILPVTSWIHFLWNELTYNTISSTPLLLNTSQEQLLWEKIILFNKENEQLIQISETADLARSAWSLLMQWQVDINHSLFNSSEDYMALANWAKKFKQLCTKNNWIDSATLPNLIMLNIIAKKITPPQFIMTYGFTEFSPQLNQLLKTCEQTGSQIQNINLEYENRYYKKRISLLDAEDEIQTIARWAKTIHEQNNKAIIGCVIPSLDKIRDRVSQIFSEVFAASSTYTVDTQNAPFNISAGKSLSQYPIINTAFQLLSAHKKTLSTEALSHILSTPFIGEAEIERIKRAQFDNHLRAKNKSFINLELSTNQDGLITKSCPKLAKRIRKFIEILNDNQYDNQSNRSHTEWSITFNKMLTALGWPGERTLNSEEYQIVESWLNLLSEFSTLDQITSSVNLQQALHMLHKIADNMIFQPKTPEAPIQVLGILEAAAMPFDYVWIAGMDDISWPPQPKPNPFIPKRLQRDLHMPHATAERELYFCTTIINQFQHSAPYVIFSHAEKDEELELQPSPLIRHFSKLNLEDLNLKEYISPINKIFSSKEIEIIIDDKAPDITTEEKIRGGVSVIKQQALCPFKSFSEWRLHAHELERPLPGLRAKDRGTVIHKTLEILWDRIQNHAILVSLSEHDLESIIQVSIDEALQAVPHSHSEFKQYISLEKQRLRNIISSWLAIEKARPPFKIMTNEKAVQFTLGSLPLTVRIDRIDELDDGKKLIIDYKTGNNNEIGGWFSDRPEEPQLPLYSLLDPENTSGISFAQIYPGEHCFKGVSHYAIEINGIKVISEIKKSTAMTWTEQIRHWNETLTKLSNDFYRGDARVDPKDGEQTCTWCALKPLCRINEEVER